VTLGPYGWIEGPPTKIRDQLRGLSTKIYEHLFSPPYPPPRSNAQCAAHVGNLDAIKRLVLLAIGQEAPPANRSAAILSNVR